MKLQKPRLLILTICSSLLACLMLITMVPSSAHAGRNGMVYGAWYEKDDWGDDWRNATIRRGVCSTNLVVLWQAILFAEGLYGFDTMEVDGCFGSNTHAKTEDLQERYGFSGSAVDGIVGKNTWGRADNRLGWEQLYGKYFLTYKASGYNWDGKVILGRGDQNLDGGFTINPGGYYKLGRAWYRNGPTAVCIQFHYSYGNAWPYIYENKLQNVRLPKHFGPGDQCWSNPL